ncbi:MAG: class I SAM-dependent methyltransferase [Acidimicrobiia bacterium]
MDFNPIADYLGEAYLKQAFTMGTRQEVEFLLGPGGLRPGMRVLDAGCGPGRHSLMLAAHGIDVVGVDLSERFIDIACAQAADRALHNATFQVADVRSLPFAQEFDAVISLCQGGFGLLGGVDEEGVLTEFARVLNAGGSLVVETFSAAFALAWKEPGETFDVANGTMHELAEVIRTPNERATFELVTTVFTPRELRLLLAAAGFEHIRIGGGAPGRYSLEAPNLRDPSLICLARAAEVA